MGSRAVWNGSETARPEPNVSQIPAEATVGRDPSQLARQHRRFSGARRRAMPGFMVERDTSATVRREMGGRQSRPRDIRYDFR